MFQMFVIACFGLSTRMKEIPTIFVQCVHEKRSRDIWFLLKCVKTQSTLQKELNSTEMLSRQLKTVNEFFNAHKRKDYSREFTLWTPNSMSVSLSFSRNGMIITIMKKKMFPPSFYRATKKRWKFLVVRGLRSYNEHFSLIPRSAVFWELNKNTKKAFFFKWSILFFSLRE